MAAEEKCRNPAPGGPGIQPHWTSSAKQAVGTAYSTASSVWYTLTLGILSELYYPTVDRPQIRDLQYLITDGKTFFHDERRNLSSEVEALSEHGLGFRITNRDPEGRYKIVKEIIADPHLSCILIRTRFDPGPGFEGKLRLFVLCAPHLEVGGWNNNGEVVEVQDRKVLLAYKGEVYLALGASAPFLRCSCGYVGVSDGWADLNDNFEMDWQYDCVRDGNIALTGEIDLSQGNEFTLSMAFQDCRQGAITLLRQSLSTPFSERLERFLEQWQRVANHQQELEVVSGDNGCLYHRSQALLLAHEDKSYPGAMIASLSIPWGEAKSDQDGLGGYHLVWTRDMVQSTTALLATGNTTTPLRSLVYLTCAQLEDGGFYQNFWISGEPYWRGVQLDEVAFPIILVWRLYSLNALEESYPITLIRRAAAYLIKNGPATPQERWEEDSGYSPSTLAANIAALTCAALFLRKSGDDESAAFVQEYADFLESHIESWTVTTQGTLVPGITTHYIRITPATAGDPHPHEDPNTGTLHIANRPPGQRADFPAKEIVDGGFLELVRYGIRKPDDPIIVDSVKVIDAVLKVDTPFGPCWHRYNHDGYGQRPDGGPFESWGKGRAWPLLTGERGHYELASGRPVEPYIKAMEAFGFGIGLLAEQVWDEEDRPDLHLYCGRPTGSAMPLMWAHAEYVKLLRSAADGKVFDLIPEVAQRYLGDTERTKLEVWKHNRQVSRVKAGWTLRIQADAPFMLHSTTDGWQDNADTQSTSTKLGIDYVDIQVAPEQTAPVEFTFHWLDGRWEEQNYKVAVAGQGAAGPNP